MLILNVILHVRIKFGNMVVTHVTTRPYKIAYVFLILALLQTVGMIYLTNIYYDGQFTEVVNLWLDSSVFKVIFVSFELFKFTWIFIFIEGQSFNHKILYIFVIF